MRIKLFSDYKPSYKFRFSNFDIKKLQIKYFLFFINLIYNKINFLIVLKLASLDERKRTLFELFGFNLDHYQLIHEKNYN